MNPVSPARTSGSLVPLLKPRSVAIIGASDDPTRIGGRPLRYLREAGFSGAIHAINPTRSTVQGMPAYKTIADVPGPVDFALIAIPAAIAVEAVEACAASGVKAMCMFTSGFAETDEAGAQAQQQVAEISRRSGMRIIGPNCLGLFNAADGFFCTFSSSFEQGFPKPGRVGIVSQSGAYGSHVSTLATRRGIDVRYWVTTGNEVDVDVAEVIGFYAADPDIDVIMAYAEGVKSKERLIHAFELARASRKPIVFFKVGRTEVGAQAAASHTASLAGSDAVYDALFRQYGVHRAKTTEELLDVAYACRPRLYPTGRKIGLVTISGGVGVQMADAATDYGLDVAPMPEDAQRELKALIPFAAPRNPVDITAQAFNDMSLVSKNLELMLDRGGYDAILAFFTVVAGAKTMAARIRQELEGVHRRFADRLIVLSIIASEEVVKGYEDAGYLIFEDPTRAIAAIKALTGFGESFARSSSETLALPMPAALPSAGVGEHEAKQILAAAGIDIVEEQVAASADEAVAAAQRFGFPVVLKIVSPDIPHKTEIGGVLLGVLDAEAVREGYAKLMERARQARPEARIDGVLVARMIRGGVETILGVTRDPVFGPVVMFGLGGIFVEVLKDVTFRVAPFDETEARRMIEEVKGVALLKGARGATPADIDALAAALSRLSLFAAANAGRIASIDINPFIVLPQGQGAMAADALITFDPVEGEND